VTGLAEAKMAQDRANRNKKAQAVFQQIDNVLDSRLLSPPVLPEPASLAAGLLQAVAGRIPLGANDGSTATDNCSS
jgi:hypothetical protein